MPSTNDEVAAAFNELADLMELAGADRFRILAYRRVAEEIGSLATDVFTMSDRDLAAVRGVGRATAEKVREIIATGTTQKLEDARAHVPAGLRDLVQLPGLGPKKVILLNKELGITSMSELEEAIAAQRLREVKGLGPKTEQNLAAAIARAASEVGRISIEEALAVAAPMVARLRKLKAVEQADHAGSLRRMRESIGDIDLLAASADPDAVMAAFVKMPEVDEVIASGHTKTSVLTKKGLQVDLRVVAPDEYGAALQYFTGSKQHNVRVREIAVKKGLKLSEYGLFRVDDDGRIASATEEDVYGALGMQVPPAPMREDRGEVELARDRSLPELVTLGEIRGDLHTHSRYSDGIGTIAEMCDAASARGYEYFAITDHGGSGHVRSVSKEAIPKQAREIAKRNASGGLQVLHGVEMDIGPEGELTFPDEDLAIFDLVIVSIHDRFEMPKDAMTARVLAALRHPRVNIFAHPTARRIGRRAGADFDLDVVFRAAAENGVALEINSTPSRLDLRDDHIRSARELGCRFVINTDAHGPSRLERMALGVGMAQRGWLTAEEVINTWPLERLKSFLDKQGG